VVAFEEQGCLAGADRYDADAHDEIRSASLTTATWQKSSWSAYNGNCVEVASLRGGLVAVRDTKDAGGGPTLVFGFEAWESFLDTLKKGDLSS
jgi:hypothetical protein